VSDDNAEGPQTFLEGLKVWLKVGVELGKSLDEQTASSRQLWRALQANTPVDYASQQSGVAVTATPLVLNFGSPDQGTFWEVMSVALGGQEENITAAGTAGLYVVGSPTLLGAGMANLADFAPTMPNAGFYGTHQLVVNDSEYLIAVIFGGTNGQTYMGNAQVTVYSYRAARGRVDTQA
jgi:hypothetical protein